MPRLLRSLVRVTLAAGLGLLVFVLAVLAAWQAYRGDWHLELHQWSTRSRLEHVISLIDAYHDAHGRLPQGLADLRPDDDWFRSYACDAWGHPFEYHVLPDGYLLLAYGRDGVLGGRGYDADLSNRNMYPPGSLPTLGQFLWDMPTGGMLKTCGAAGAVAAVLGFVLLQVPLPGRRSTIVLLLALATTAIGATIVGMVIAGLHIPTGH